MPNINPGTPEETREFFLHLGIENTAPELTVEDWLKCSGERLLDDKEILNEAIENIKKSGQQA